MSNVARRQVDEIRRCHRDPKYFFKTYGKVSHPLKGTIPFQTYQFQDECIDAFIENRYVIVNKSRQLGLSTLAAAYAAWLLIFNKNKEVVVMATKLKTAMNFIKKVRFFVKNLPPWLVLPKIVEDNKQSLVFGHPSNSRIEAIPTAADAGRSEALSLLIVDEAAHVDGFEELWKGLYPTLSCVVGGTKVLLDDGFHDIEELCVGHEIGDYFELCGNIYGKDGLEPLSHGYVSPESETLKITTRHGLELEVTKQHPLWVLDAKEGGKMVKAVDLSVGDHLRIQYNMGIYGNDNSLDHPTVKEITPELAYLVGGYIAEGWIPEARYSVQISNSDEDFREKFLNNRIIKPFVEAQNKKLICCSREMVELFEVIGVDASWKCHTKRVPKKIWRASKAVQASFLRGYFDGDGSFGRSVGASSTSHSLLLDIQQLLLNMGFNPTVEELNYQKIKKVIGTFIGQNKNPVKSVRRSWRISIPTSQNKKFVEEIGFNISRKQRKAKESLNELICDEKYIWQVPLTASVFARIKRILAESGKAPGWFNARGVCFPEDCEVKLTKRNKKRKFRCVTVKLMSRLISLLETNSIVSDEDAAWLHEVVSDVFFWDDIVSIEKSKNKTYDFTVPKTHSFLQNCILGSNTGGRALIISTPKGTGGWFHKLWVDAQDGTNEFHPIELPWHVHPERTDEWFQQQTKNMSPKAIAQELLCDFLSSGDTYLDASDIDWVGQNIKKPIRRDGPENNVWIWEEPLIDSSIKYIIPADVGRGDGMDFSAFHVLCVSTGAVVAEYKGKIRPDHFAKLLTEYGNRYNTALLCPERNTYGHHVLVELVNNGYKNIYFQDQSGVYIGSYIPQDRVGEAGFDTNSASRKRIVTKLEEVIRNRQIKVFSSRLHNELKTFVIHGDKPQAQKHCHDDLVMSLAIGVWLFDASSAYSQFADDLNKAMLSAFSISVNTFDNMAGNGNEVLPSWTAILPTFGNTNQFGPSHRRQPDSREADASDTFWLFK
jgi:intein/homing endonuclease